MYDFRKLFKKRPILPVKGFGLIEQLPEMDDFRFGSVEARKYLLSEERDYTKYLPTTEPQSKAFDTFSCVSFSAMNNLEIIYKRQFGVELNFSDRYLASLSDTVPNQGNSFKKVADTLRKFGAVLEEEYPFGGMNEYEYVRKPEQYIVDKGKAFLLNHEIEYEWVGYGGCRPEVLYSALQFGPLQVSADANALRTKEYSIGVNHAVTIYKSVYKRSFSIFDHYDGYTYDVPWGFYFGSAMQFSLIKKKFIPLVRIFNKPEIYAILGTTACHVKDENSWNYGVKVGIWEKGEQVISQNNFDQSFTVGQEIIFK